MGGEVQPRPGPTASHSTPSLTAPVRQCPNVPANSRQSGPRAPLTVSYPAISLTTATVGRHRHPQKRLQTAADPASTRIRAPTIHVCYFLSPLPVSSPRPSLSIGGFGFNERQFGVFKRRSGSCRGAWRCRGRGGRRCRSRGHGSRRCRGHDCYSSNRGRQICRNGGFRGSRCRCCFWRTSNQQGCCKREYRQPTKSPQIGCEMDATGINGQSREFQSIHHSV